MVNAYITDQQSGKVSVIDTSTNTVAATISVGNGPSGSVVTPDGSKAYSTNRTDGTVSVINTATNTVVATITVGSSPWGIGITPDGSKAYVVNNGSNTVTPINLSTNTAGTAITVGSSPSGIAITPDGSKAYITNTSGNSISVINTATNTVSTTITGFTNPSAIAITPDGKTAFICNGSSTGTVSVLDTATNTVRTGTGYPISVGNGPAAIAITPDGTIAYVVNEIDSTVSVIDLTTSPPAIKTGTGYPISVGSIPIGVAFTPDGSTAYVANQTGGTVSVINVSSHTVSTTITIGSGNSPTAFGQFIQPATQPIIPPSTPPTLFSTTPQGRLTLSSVSPVMTADSTAQSTVYYLPYNGAIVPVYNGAQFVNYLMGSSGISLALDSNSGHTGYQTSGSLFDIFAFMNGGLLTLGTGPAWTNSTTRSAAITQVNGIWVNSASITLRFGSSSGNTTSVAANQATYLGTMYATANGQTGMACFPTAASGGTNNILGLWNAYNRVPITAQCLDSTVTWTYGTAAWRNANNSASNRISFVDGLGQSNFIGSYNQTVYNASSAGYEDVGVGVNSTASGGAFVSEGSGSTQNAVYAQHNSYPIMGFNYIQALEYGDGTHAATFYGGGANLQLLTLQISM